MPTAQDCHLLAWQTCSLTLLPAWCSKSTGRCPLSRECTRQAHISVPQIVWALEIWEGPAHRMVLAVQSILHCYRRADSASFRRNKDGFLTVQETGSSRPMALQFERAFLLLASAKSIAKEIEDESTKCINKNGD